MLIEPDNPDPVSANPPYDPQSSMKNSLVAPLVCCLICASASQTSAQGTFENLGFEGVKNVPSPWQHQLFMPATDALPGWNCYIGETPIGVVAYEGIALDSAYVGIVSRTNEYAPRCPFPGDYALSLQYGVTGSSQGVFSYSPAAVAQSGLVPAEAQSIRLIATYPFLVTFEGDPIPLVPLRSEGDYAIYGGDISLYAGQSGELRITSYSHFNYLDAVTFSPVPIPEPSSVGMALVGLYLSRRVRRMTS